MTSNNFIPTITAPTRITDKSATLIDHIFIKLPRSKINNKIVAGNLLCDISDHLPNFTIINIDIKKLLKKGLILGSTTKLIYANLNLMLKVNYLK